MRWSVDEMRVDGFEEDGPSVATVTFNGRESKPRNSPRSRIYLRSACTQMGAAHDQIYAHAQKE